jgi:hypothetical protein
MQKRCLFAAIFAVGLCTTAHSQIRQASVPLGDAISKALAKGLLTGEGSRPFHIRVIVSEPENQQSPYQGTIEEWWSLSTQWRREVTAKEGMHQTIIVVNGKKGERDEGDYFPLWLRNFVTALFDPVPDASAWTANGVTIDQTIMPNGDKSDACARIKSKIGTGDRITDGFSNVCFDDKGRFKFIGSPRFSMSFNHYRGFGEKDIARALGDAPEPGTGLGGDVVQLEDLSKAMRDGLFTPLPSNDNRFDSLELGAAKLEELTAGNAPVVWPAVRSGNLQGNLAIYISVDSQGHVREVWPLNSDNAGLEDPAREQVRKWTITPLKDSNGNPVQADGALGFRFQTAMANPIPVLSDAEARQLAIKTTDPKFAPGTALPGTRYRVRVAVNEQGKVTGGAAEDTEVPDTIKPPGPALFPIMMAVRNWQFQPLMKEGVPQYFFAELVFTVR